MIGIYKITSPTGKIYIGQSTNIKSRLTRYKNMSIKTEGQPKIWRSLKKYGSENHKFEVLHECTIELLNVLERKYQEIYDSVENGLNCVYTKTNDKSGLASKETRKKMSIAQKNNWDKNKHLWIGRTHSDEAKNKISIANKGRKFSEKVNKSKGRKGITPPLKGLFGKDNPISKKICQYDINGNLIKVWDCGLDIKRELGFNNTNISSCCNGRLTTSSGYIWQYL